MYREMIEAMDTLKKERTGGRRSGVCSVVSGRRAVLVAAIWTIRMTIAPVDVLDALVPGGAFELVRRAFPLCILFCSAGHMRREHTHFYTYIFTHITRVHIRISLYIYIFLFFSKAESHAHSQTSRSEMLSMRRSSVSLLFLSSQLIASAVIIMTSRKRKAALGTMRVRQLAITIWNGHRTQRKDVTSTRVCASYFTYVHGWIKPSFV